MLRKLFFIQLKGAYSNLLRIGHSKKTGKTNPLVPIIMAALILYAMCSMMVALGYMYYTMAQSFVPLGLSWLLFAYAGFVSFCSSSFMCIFMSQSMLFEARDNPLLLALPIKPKTILGSRLMVLYFSELVTIIPCLVPAGAIYAWYFKTEPLFYVLFTLTILLLPLLSVAVSALIGFLVSLLARRMRNQNFFTILFYFAFIGIYFWAVRYLNGSGMQQLIASGVSMATSYQRLLPPFYYLGQALTRLDLLSALYAALWILLPFALIMLLLSKTFISFATSSKKTKRIAYKEKLIKQKGLSSALLLKELKRFAATPMYLLNSGFGYILEIGLGVYIFFAGVEKIIPPELNLSSMAILGCVAVLSFCAGMSYTTAPSISLERDSLWILRSGPIPTGKIFDAKIAMNLVLGFPAIIITGTLISLRLHPSLQDAILLFTLPLAVQWFTAQHGLLCNLLFPKLDGINDTIIVKQSASVLAATFISLGSLAVMIFLFVAGVLLLGINYFITGLILLAIILAIDVGLLLFLRTKGVKMFERI